MGTVSCRLLFIEDRCLIPLLMQSLYREGVLTTESTADLLPVGLRAPREQQMRLLEVVAPAIDGRSLLRAVANLSARLPIAWYFLYDDTPALIIRRRHDGPARRDGCTDYVQAIQAILQWRDEESVISANRICRN